MGDLSTIKRAMREEIQALSVRTIVLQNIIKLLPVDTFPRIRMRLYQLMGIQIGAGTVLTGSMRLTGGPQAFSHLKIGRKCYLNDGIYFNLGASVVIEDRVSVGMKCLFLTISHKIGDSTFRAGQHHCQAISIGEGSWIAASVTVLPGVNIGGGTIVGAGAVVNKDLPSNVFAAGNPARPIKHLEKI